MTVKAFAAMAFFMLVFGAVLYAWFHKFFTGRSDKYGKPPGHDLPGMERWYIHISDGKRFDRQERNGG